MSLARELASSISATAVTSTNAKEWRGGIGTGTSTAGVLKLTTAETTVVDADQLGRIDFSAPLEASGTDALLVGASIYAEADDTFAADNNATELVFATGSTAAAAEKMRLTSDGKVGIGTTAPASLLDVQGTVQVGGIPDALQGMTPALQIEGVTTNLSSVSLFRNSNDANSPYLILGKSRGTSVGADTIVQDNDELGTISFVAADGVDRVSAVAEIKALVGGTPGANDTPGELLFMTCADGAQVTTERIRIMADGKVGIGTATPATDLSINGTITLKEQAEADGDTTAYGQIWVNTASVPELYFTGDTGVDIQITSATGLGDGTLATTGKAIAMAIVFGG